MPEPSSELVPSRLFSATSNAVPLAHRSHAAAAPRRAPHSASHGPVLVPSRERAALNPKVTMLVDRSVAVGDRTYEFSKRLLDVVGAIIGLIGFLPLMLLIVVAVKTTSRGPIFFKHKRLGRHGREFWCYKFRTMVANAERILAESPELRRQFRTNFKIVRDPRITPIGNFLRRTSLDELPQFWNVLRGDMTLIGPRPIVVPELEKYGPFAGKLLRVKPGLSGLWQACGRSDTSYEQRIALDMLYIDKRCIVLDLRLLVSTLSAVFQKAGAY